MDAAYFSKAICQMSLNLPRSPFTDATITTVLSKGSGPVLECYNDFFHEIQTRPCYDPIFHNDLIGDDATKDTAIITYLLF